MTDNQRNKIRFLVSLLVMVVITISCDKLSNLSSGDSQDKLYFCEKYDLANDKCEGKSTKYTSGRLTVMVDLRPSKRKLGVTKVNINVTDINSGKPVDTFEFNTESDMDYVYFEGVNFKEPGKYRVSALKPDGTVIVSNEIEIVE
ncbi:MAG: hypothetical protein HGGPFJEG_01339 [Ignavibacteria bacterium]|nr:hypothetical protein [Ignavibacteria bacterium]